MSDVLHIQSSSNLGGSVSRELSEAFVRDHMTQQPNARLVRRDLVASPIPHAGVDLVGGMFGQPETLTGEQKAALAISDQLIGEIEAASLIVIGVPMYNFSIPSALKAWIDHVVRAGRTFRYGATGPEGLVFGKRLVLFLASGGVYSEGPYKPYDFQESYLRAIFGFIGVTDVTAIRAEGLAMGEESRANAIGAARQQAAKAA